MFACKKRSPVLREMFKKEGELSSGYIGKEVKTLYIEGYTM